MGAISLYRGNLHRVPDVPRRWLMPTREISLKDFKTLLRRRTRALTRNRANNAITTSTAAASTTPLAEPQEGAPRVNDDSNPNAPLPETEPFSGTPSDVRDQEKSNAADCSRKVDDEPAPPLLSEPVAVADAEEPSAGKEISQALVEIEKPVTSENPNLEMNQTSQKLDALDDTEMGKNDTLDDKEAGNEGGALYDKEASKKNMLDAKETGNKVDALDDKGKRKKEVEEKLHEWNEKKHNLVQVLKQILSAEEELKRRNNVQAMAGRSPVPLQVDVGNESASASRHVTPRMGSEGNLGRDLAGGEADDNSNHNMHSRNLLRMSSTSPSSESPLRKPVFSQHTAVPHPARANFSMASSPSPSRFAPTGNQAQPPILPTVSVSGTSYIASSPSPASGSTSVFREARLPSPWN